MAVQQIATLMTNNKRLRIHIYWVLLMGLFASLSVMFSVDQVVSMFFSKNDIREAIRTEARFLTDLGLSEIYFALALFSWAFCKWVGPRLTNKASQSFDFFRRWGLNLLVSLIVSGAMVHILKFLVGRQRPHKSPTFDPYIFNNFTTHWHWHSFPSGHTQVIFTAATLFAVAFPRLKWFWFSFAVLIGLTRIVVHDHFLSDVIFGGCVGYLGALLSLKLMQSKTKNGLF